MDQSPATQAPSGQAVTRTRVDEVTATLEAMLAEHRRRGVMRLPPETDLSRDLGVSRNTLRAALSRLEAAGAIERRRRVGTLIKHVGPHAVPDSLPDLAYPVDIVQSVADFFIEANVAYAVRSVTLNNEEPDAAAAEHLRLSEGEFVYRVTRIYEANGTPAVIVQHSLPHKLNGASVKISSLADGVTSFLHEVHNIRLSRSDHWVTAISADAELSEALEVAAGAPLLSVSCKLYTQGGRRRGRRDTPVAIGRLVFRPDLVCVRATADVVVSPPADDTGRS